MPLGPERTTERDALAARRQRRRRRAALGTTAGLLAGAGLLGLLLEVPSKLAALVGSAPTTTVAEESADRPRAERAAATEDARTEARERWSPSVSPGPVLGSTGEGAVAAAAPSEDAGAPAPPGPDEPGGGSEPAPESPAVRLDLLVDVLPGDQPPELVELELQGSPLLLEASALPLEVKAEVSPVDVQETVDALPVAPGEVAGLDPVGGLAPGEGAPLPSAGAELQASPLPEASVELSAPVEGLAPGEALAPGEPLALPGPGDPLP